MTSHLEAWRPYRTAWHASTHKIEELGTVSRTGAVLIGCACGWTHIEGPSLNARKKARQAMATHKATAKDGS